MTETPRAPRRIARQRTDVLDAARGILAERGVEATRFADVSAATGVGSSTLQYWFGSREDMLVAIFRRAADHDLEAVSAHLAAEPDPWRQLVHVAAYLTGNTDPDDEIGWRLWIEWWRWALRDDEVRAEVLSDYTRWRELIARCVTAGQHTGIFTIESPPQEIAHQILAFFDGLALPVALGDPTITREHAHELLTDALARLVAYRMT